MDNRFGLVSFSIVGVLLATAIFMSSETHPIAQIQNSKTNDVNIISDENPREGVAEIVVPAVDSEGNGVLGKFEVQVLPGNGKTLTNIDNLLYFVDTQFSIQTAKSVAANFTGTDITKYNLVYGIETSNGESSIVEGPSAGAALTIATIAALENKTLDTEVAITGSINPDGTIGRVGGINSKLNAVSDVGLKVFLVPEGQGLKPSYKVDTNCDNINKLKICRTEYKAQKSIMTTDSGVIVREVPNISEALKYFVH